MPIVGTLLDNFTTPVVLGVLVVVAATIGTLQVLPNLVAQYMTVLIFAIYRPLYYTSVSDYCAKIFGFRTFGKVYGAMICIAGIFNLVQEFLDHLVNSDVFNGNPVPVDLSLMIITSISGTAVWVYVGIQSRRRNLRV